MNKWIYITIGFMAGAGAGASACYYILKTKFDDRLDHELAGIEGYKKEIEEKYVGTPEEVEGEQILISEAIKAHPVKRTDYTHPETISKEDESDDIVDDSVFIPEWPRENEEDNIYEIPEIELGNNGYIVSELTCYNLKNIFDSDDHELNPDEIERYIGLGFDDGIDIEEDTVKCIRNDTYETDYRIVFKDISPQLFGEEDEAD